MRRIPSYRNPGVGYRRPGIGYRRYYEDVTPADLALTQPARRAVTVRVYDKEDLLVAQVSSNAQTCSLLGADWELTETGCGAFELETSEPLPVDHDYRIDIHLWNNPDPIYSGLVDDIPEDGSTEQTYQYSGYGFFTLLNRMLVTNTYPAQSIRGIILDLAQQAAARVKRFEIAPALVAGTSYSMVGELDFLRTPLKDAFDQVADLAGDYIWGINAKRQFFFQPRSSEVDQHLWVGKHLETWVPRQSSADIVNYLVIKFGKVRTDLDPSNPYFKTNWIVDPIQDDESIAIYGVREGIYNANSLLGEIDAQQAGLVELNRRKAPRRYASVSGLVYNGEALSCLGSARVVGKGGREVILPKKSLKFSLKDTFVDVSVELGDLEYGAELILARLASVAANETLARQQSQKQL